MKKISSIVLTILLLMSLTVSSYATNFSNYSDEQVSNSSTNLQKEPPSCPGCEEYVIDNDNKTLSIQSNILIGQFISDMKNRGEINVTVYKNDQKVIYGYFEVGMTVDMYYFDNEFVGTYTVTNLTQIPASNKTKLNNTRSSYNYGFCLPLDRADMLSYVFSDFGWRDLYGEQNYHTGTDYSWGDIDGAPIRAVQSGVVTISSSSTTGYGNQVEIDHSNTIGVNIKTQYAHMKASPLVLKDQTVTKGQIIGYVGMSGNATGEHLHFEVRKDGQSVNPEPYLTNATVYVSSSFPKLGAVSTSNQFKYKQGTLSSAWQETVSNVDKIQLTDDVFDGMKKTDNTLYIRPVSGGNWTQVTTGCRDFKISESRICSLQTNNSLIVKDSIASTWTTLTTETSIADFQLDNDRIYMLSSGGTLFVKDGIGSPWLTLITSCSSFSVDGNNICAITTNGNLYLKTGLQSTWNLISNPVTSIKVDGDKFYAIMEASKSLFVKVGAGGTWTLLDTGVNKIQVEGNKIFVLNGTSLNSKTGIGGAWVERAKNVSDFKFAGNRLAYKSTSNDLYVKDGFDTSWTSTLRASNVSTFDITGL